MRTKKKQSGQLLSSSSSSSGTQAGLTSAVFRTPLPELPRAEPSQNQNTTDIVAPLFPVRGWRDAARRRDGESVCVRAYAGVCVHE